MEEPEYISSATLMILGDDLDPEDVTKKLGYVPSQSWRRDATHEWGGWKRFVDPEHTNDPLEEQVEFWCSALRDRTEAISRLKSQGCHCALDLFVTTDATASIIIPELLQKQIAALGLELRLSIQIGNGSEQQNPELSPAAVASDEA